MKLFNYKVYKMAVSDLLNLSNYLNSDNNELEDFSHGLSFKNNQPSSGYNFGQAEGRGDYRSFDSKGFDSKGFDSRDFDSNSPITVKFNLEGSGNDVTKGKMYIVPGSKDSKFLVGVDKNEDIVLTGLATSKNHKEIYLALTETNKPGNFELYYSPKNSSDSFQSKSRNSLNLSKKLSFN